MAGRRTAQFVTGALVALSLLGGCDDDGTDGAGTPDPVDAGTTDAGGEAGNREAGNREADTREAELADGSSLTVRLDVSAHDAAIVPFELFRQQTHAPAQTWIVAEITPPDDADGTGRFLTFVEPGADPSDDGDGVTRSAFACSVLDDWFAEAPDQGDSLRSDYVALLEGPCGGQTVQVPAPAGQTTTYLLVYEGELPGSARVFAEAGTELAPA